MADVASSMRVACTAGLQAALVTPLDVSCWSDSGYSFWVAKAPPTDAQQNQICKSTKCKTLIEELRVAAPVECVTLDGVFLYQDYLTPILTKCSWLPTPSPTPPPTPAPTPAATPVDGTTTTAPSTVWIDAGCVVSVLISIALVVWTCRPKEKTHKTHKHLQQNDPEAHTGDSGFVAMAADDATSIAIDPTLVASAHVIDSLIALRLPLNKIRLIQRLSSINSGVSSCEVYRGTYKNDVVAIKRLLPQHRNNVRRIKSFLQEVQLMASLEHERIVTFVGVAWNSVSDICALSEFMSGGDLRSVLSQFDAQQKPMGFDQTKTKIALHVAHALTYLHSLQPVVLHRDLKSSNILLSSGNMDAKITDFGVSRERAESTMTRGVGTSLWMAPEVMNGGRYDEKADVFSFGVVLSELDTNKLPYATQLDLNATSTKMMEVMQRVALGKLAVKFSDALDPGIAALGRACVAVDPADRPHAYEILYRFDQVWRDHCE